MSIKLSRLLDELREDHRNLDLLLNLLEAECENATDNELADFELMHDIMQYMTIYPDAVHHPKEDLVYTALRQHSADLAEGLEGVAYEHREIAELGTTLRSDIEAIISGAAVTREHLVEDLRNYVGRLRRHMAWEEQDLFPRADELAREDRSASIDVALFPDEDPLFGATKAGAFSNLLNHLRR